MYVYYDLSILIKIFEPGEVKIFIEIMVGHSMSV